MDITTVFGTVIVGSNPAGGTKLQGNFEFPEKALAFVGIRKERIYFSVASAKRKFERRVSEFLTKMSCREAKTKFLFRTGRRTCRGHKSFKLILKT